jgi:pyruvate,water dikinase
MIHRAPLPDAVAAAILSSYRELKKKGNEEPVLAVRSSATAEDLPGASFAGYHVCFST